MKYSNKQFEDYKYRVKLLVQDLKGNDLINADFYTDCEDKAEISLKLLSAAQKKYKKDYTAKIIHWATKEQDDLSSKFLDEILKDI